MLTTRRAIATAFVAGILVACVGEDAAQVSGTEPPRDDGGATSSDGSNDAQSTSDGSSTDGGTSCWPFRPAGYDPCAAGFDADHPSGGPKTIDGDATFDTNKATDTIADGGATYALYRYASFTVSASGKLTIKGSLPALIVVDGDVVIDGKIMAEPSATVTPPATCTKLDLGTTTGNCTAGAGGGGYGAEGAGGGGTSATGGVANGNPKITPLRFGCPGGKSGTPMPVSNMNQTGAYPASGGPGGGAFAISAKGSIRLSNTATVVANGGGGAGGDAHAGGQAPCNTMDSNSCDTGGGGGGSGGSIILEGTDVNVMGAVCAVGGGGGAGGASGGVAGVGGQTSTSCALALGGPTPIAGGAGGALESAAKGTASPSCGNTSSGGGGGGVGRIRIRASGQLAVTGTVVPPAFTM